MTRAWLIAVAVLACGCRDRARERVVTGTMPGVSVPVGPIPGPGVAPTATASTYAASPEVRVEGRRLFVRYNCSGCHGGHGGGGMGPSLRDEDWIYGDSDLLIFDSIAEGRAHGMPAWGIRIPEREVWKLVAYIQSLRTEREPEPPR